MCKIVRECMNCFLSWVNVVGAAEHHMGCPICPMKGVDLHPPGKRLIDENKIMTVATCDSYPMCTNTAH